MRIRLETLLGHLHSRKALFLLVLLASQACNRPSPLDSNDTEDTGEPPEDAAPAPEDVALEVTPPPEDAAEDTGEDAPIGPTFDPNSVAIDAARFTLGVQAADATSVAVILATSYADPNSDAVAATAAPGMSPRNPEMFSRSTWVTS